MFKRKMIKTGRGYRHFRLSIPGEVACALHAENEDEVNLEVVETAEGKRILVVYRGD